ncbi:DUF2971 domain-containing protein [Azospirillum sp. ST 5-10]|uniref:DUF2971 domain-containing protein n=1 Tax=unclassified Azospirillum TaxID=2630922 RepID=UPI003F4A8142
MADPLAPYSREDLYRHLRYMEYAGDPLEPYFRKSNIGDLPEDGIIYHYCSIEGFHGILSSSCLWASPAHTLNDLDEMHDGARVIKECLRIGSEGLEATKEPGSEAEDDDVFRKLMCSYFDSRWTPPQKFNIYTVSFSEDGDSSSQWLNYSEQSQHRSVKGRGFAIGFSARHLHNASHYLNYRFGPCRYARREKQAIVDGALDLCISYIRYMLSCGLNFGGCMEWAEERFFYSALPTLPFYKNQTFANEKEWRAVVVPGVWPWATDVVDVRGEKREIIRFQLHSTHHKFPGHTYLPIFRVIAGSGVSEDDLKDAREALDMAGLGDVKIDRSECRLR